MTLLYVTMSEIRKVTGLGTPRLRQLLRLPYSLPFSFLPAPKKGGRQSRLYTFADIVPRLRQFYVMPEPAIIALLNLAQNRHRNKGLTT